SLPGVMRRTSRVSESVQSRNIVAKPAPAAAASGRSTTLIGRAGRLHCLLEVRVPLKIKQDHSRFREIIRGRIKENLRKYIQKGEMIGKKGKDLSTIPVPSIDIPHFRYGHKDQGGVGQGDGQPGTVLAPGAVEGDGKGKAGQGEGQHSLEVDLSLDELADILGEELALPRIQSKGKKNLTTPK